MMMKMKMMMMTMMTMMYDIDVHADDDDDFAMGTLWQRMLLQYISREFPTVVFSSRFRHMK